MKLILICGIYSYSYVCILRSLVISIAKTVGAAVALLLGRTLLNRWVQNTLKNSPHLAEIYTAMGKDTFKLAVMLRLSPVPSWVNNYGLALTPISLKYVPVATLSRLRLPRTCIMCDSSRRFTINRLIRDFYFIRAEIFSSQPSLQDYPGSLEMFTLVP